MCQHPVVQPPSPVLLRTVRCPRGRIKNFQRPRRMKLLIRRYLPSPVTSTLELFARYRPMIVKLRAQDRLTRRIQRLSSTQLTLQHLALPQQSGQPHCCATHLKLQFSLPCDISIKASRLTPLQLPPLRPDPVGLAVHLTLSSKNGSTTPTNMGSHMYCLTKPWVLS